MDTIRYRAFLTAADSGSIRVAADILGYTPSGVSQLIQSLEKELNITLFRRGKKGVTLTSSGEMLLPVVRSIISQENNLLQVAADLNGTVFGTINVASYHSLASAWMPQLVARFQKDFPQVRINIFEGTQKDIVEHLISGKSDIAFFNNSMMTGRYDWIPIKSDPMMAVVPKGHKLAGLDKFPVEAFRGERFIMPENGFDYDVMEIFDEYGIVPDIYLSTFDSYILLKMVENGLGVSLVNEACLDERIDKGKVRAIPLDPPRCLEMGIAVLSLKDASPAVKKFIEYAS